ncbi:MAG: winged helix DNA-binding domain-containing protein [Gemmatimonadales bacterium]
MRDRDRIPDQRLRNQLITRPGSRRPDKVVAWLGAVQAQEYGPAKWGLALRSSTGITDAMIERAIDQGRILRTHVLRPTWHFVSPADIRWMLDLTGPIVHRRMSPYDRRMGLDPETLIRATGVIEKALGDGAHLTRGELGVELTHAGLPGRTRELAHIMMYAELEGVVCSGPRRGKQSTYALLADRAPAARRLDRDAALGELARRYFRSHGPATVRDFVWWSGLGTADAKRGVEISRARGWEVDGVKYWTIGPSPRVTRSRKTGVHLLPVYDEYLVAYRDHHAVPRPAYVMGSLQHALVIGGQVAGAWKAIPGSTSVGVTPTRRLTPGDRRAVAQAATRYGRFLALS